ncbi:hypothetical protein, partial [Listeria seeligeri]|uniref:hypothetical protein n=1 Tax=Listeria seeligeri TaxID=1640 RepID=UPI001C88F933
PPLISFYMNSTKVFFFYSHFLVAVPHLGGSFFISNEFLMNLQWKNDVFSATIGKGIIEK